MADVSIDINTAKWLSLQDACRYACVSENTLKGFLKDGHIYGKLIGGKWIIDRESIDDYYNTDRAAEQQLFEKIKQGLSGRRKKVDSRKLRVL